MRPSARPHQSEIDLQEARDRILVRSGEAVRHDLIRRGAGGVVVHELSDQLSPVLARSSMNARVKKQGVSDTGKVGATPAAAVRMDKQPLVLRRSPGLVERLPPRRDHRRA